MATTDYDQFTDWRWRLNNLYRITDENGKIVPFRMNWAQEALFNEMHYLNVVLKARQLGFSTFIQLFLLDRCIFYPATSAGVIAHTREDAEEIFRNKIKFAVDGLRHTGLVSFEQDSARSLTFGNKSHIRVGTSLRSGTIQYLHISEYGKICARYPEKAQEIKTGALNTVHAGNVAFIESTAEGQEGHFFELCQDAQAKARRDVKLTPLDWKFHFFPWWRHPQYTLDPDGVEISADLRDYFSDIERGGVDLTDGQKAWYAKKAEIQQDDMKREYPSTPDEAFDASVEGAYYAKQMAKAESDGRVTRVPYDPALPVETWWDIGVDDYTSIWLVQRGRADIRCIKFIQGEGEGLGYYIARLSEWSDGHEDVTFSAHYWPHDGNAREWGNEGRRRSDTARDKGLKVTVLPKHDVNDGIDASRNLISRCVFDAEECADGIHALKHYRKEWDDNRAVWKSTPRHDENSHGADAFRTGAMSKAPAKKRGAINYPPNGVV